MRVTCRAPAGRARGGFRLLRPAQKPEAVTPELPPFLPKLVPRLLPVTLGSEHATPPVLLCANTSCLVSDPSCVSPPRSAPFIHSTNRGLASDLPWGLATQVASKASASAQARPCPVCSGSSGSPLACAPRLHVIRSTGPSSLLALRLDADCQDEGQRKQKVPPLFAFVGIVNMFYS